jgi:hypothetical protein
LLLQIVKAVTNKGDVLDRVFSCSSPASVI